MKCFEVWPVENLFKACLILNQFGVVQIIDTLECGLHSGLSTNLDSARKPQEAN